MELPCFVTPAGATTPNLRLDVMAIAAALALLLAGAAGWILHDSVRSDYAGLVAPPSLQRALEETPSEVSARLSGDLSIRPTLPFASLQKRWCREYVLSMPIVWGPRRWLAVAMMAFGELRHRKIHPQRPSRKTRKRMCRRARLKRQEPAGQSRSPNTETGLWCRPVS